MSSSPEQSSTDTIKLPPIGALLSCGQDKSIKIWDQSLFSDQFHHSEQKVEVNIAKPVVLQQHNAIVSCMKSFLLKNTEDSSIKPQRVFCSASWDKSMKLFQPEYSSEEKKHNWKCKKIFNGHASEVLSMCAYKQNYALTGAIDGTIKMWNLYTKNNKKRCAMTMQLEKDNPVWCLETMVNNDLNESEYTNSSLLFCGTNLDEISVVDLDKNEVSMNLRGHKESVRTLLWMSKYRLLLSGSLDGCVNIWDIRQPFRPIAKLEHHDSGVLSSTLFKGGKNFVTGGMNGSIYGWELTGGSIGCVKQIKAAHTSSVSALHNPSFVETKSGNTKLPSNFMVSAGGDQKLCFWDFESNDHYDKPLFRIDSNGIILSLDSFCQNEQ